MFHGGLGRVLLHSCLHLPSTPPRQSGASIALQSDNWWTFGSGPKTEPISNGGLILARQQPVLTGQPVTRTSLTDGSNKRRCSLETKESHMARKIQRLQGLYSKNGQKLTCFYRPGSLHQIVQFALIQLFRFSPIWAVFASQSSGIIV